MNDSEIIELYFKRDTKALQYTQDKYERKLRLFSERLLCNREDSMECVNDALLDAWNTIPPNKPGSLLAYLYILCRGAAIDQIRWKNAEKRKAVCVELTKEMEECITGGEINTDEKMKELGLTIETYLKTLTQEKRMMFMRRYWYGDSSKTIAKSCQCSASRVDVTLFRIRQNLREYLEREGFDI